MADTFCMSLRSKLGKVSSARLLQHALARTLKSQVCCISTLQCQELWCQASYLKQNSRIYINLLSLERFCADYKARCNVALIHTKLSKGFWLFEIKQFNALYKTHTVTAPVYTLYIWKQSFKDQKSKDLWEIKLTYLQFQRVSK